MKKTIFILTAIILLAGCQGESRLSGTVEEVMDITCSSDAECPLPGEYAVRSSCPFRTVCLNNKCIVYCPDREQWGSLPTPLIGGQRDEKGCLGPAGYIWSDKTGACIREWELNEDQQRAAGIAVNHAGWEYATTIIGVDVARCTGCFAVHLEKGDGRRRYDVTLENWEVKEKSLTPDECLAQGGHTVNITGGETCDEGEKNIGKVTGFISPNICCAETNESMGSDCEKAGGNWLSGYRECEYVSQTWCRELGGEWKECESACHHNPEAEVCTMQCVPVCRLAPVEDTTDINNDVTHLLNFKF